MQTAEHEYHSIAVKPPTKTRFDDLKPFESLSHDEFVAELLDLYEVVEAAPSRRSEGAGAASIPAR